MFTLELLRDLQARQELSQNQAGEWEQTHSLDWGALPPRVEAAIAERILKLPEVLVELLQVASVEGEWFTAEVVASIQEIPSSLILKRLGEELDRKHQLVWVDSLVHIDGQRLSRYRFRHILFQKYLYASLDPARRASLHEQVGRTTERLYREQADEISGQLARHYEEAGLLEKAGEFLNRAGDRAARLSANAEAVAYYSHALELVSEEEPLKRFQLLLKRERIYHDTSQRQEEERDIQALEALGGKLGLAQRAEAALRRAWLETATYTKPATFEAAQMAVVWARASGYAAVEAMAYIYMARSGNLRDFHQMVERGLVFARKAGLKEPEAYALMLLGNEQLTIGKYELALSYSRPALQIFQELGDRTNEAIMFNTIGRSFGGLGDNVQAISNFEKGQQIFRQIGNRFEEMEGLMDLADLYMQMGCWDDMAESLLEAVDNTQDNENPRMKWGSRFYLSIFHWLRGEYPQSLVYADQAMLIARNWEFGRYWEAMSCELRGVVFSI